jgi:hypothetical protein
MVGFKSIYLATVTKDDATGYVDEDPVALPYAGKMTMTPKETQQDLYYDDALQLSLRDLKGYDTEINLGSVDLETLEELGLGIYDSVTGTLDEQMIPTPKTRSLRFIADTTDKLPFAVKYRNFTITSIRETGFTTRGDSIAVNEVVIYGTISQPMYTGAAYRTKLQMLEGDPHPNQAAFDALVTDAETLPPVQA